MDQVVPVRLRFSDMDAQRKSTSVPGVGRGRSKRGRYPLVALLRWEYTRRRLKRRKRSALCLTLLSSLSRFSWWLDV